MPSSKPVTSQFHIDQFLTDFAIGYSQEMPSIADLAFTPVRVNKESNKYPIFSQADWTRIDMQVRANGDVSAGGGFALSSDSYFCETYALHTYLTDRDRNNAMNEVDLEQSKIRYLMHQAMLKRNQLFYNTAFATSTWSAQADQAGGSSVSTNQFIYWSTTATSTPIDDLIDGSLAIQGKIGRKANVGVTSRPVMWSLLKHPDVVDRIKYSGQIPAIPTEQALAQVLGLDAIYVSDTVYNSANEGQSASMSQLFANSFLLLYRSPSPMLDEPTAGATFSWSEFDQVSAGGAAVASWYDQDRKATKFEAEMALDVKITAADAGCLFTGCIQ